MSIQNVHRIKNLLVASCDSVKQGNRDIAINLMDIALDEMDGLEAEDLEVGLVVVPTVEDSAENAFENEVFEEEEPLSDQAAYTDLRSIVSNMVAKK